MPIYKGFDLEHKKPQIYSIKNHKYIGENGEKSPKHTHHKTKNNQKKNKHLKL